MKKYIALKNFRHAHIKNGIAFKGKEVEIDEVRAKQLLTHKYIKEKK